MGKGYAEYKGWPVPDNQTAYRFHAKCPKCGAPLVLSHDVSEGPPSEIGVDCENCGACPVWRLEAWWETQATEYLRDDAERLPTATSAGRRGQ